MALFLFANDAATTLAGPIAANSTTANLAAGSGALFPTPTAGQQFAVTFTKAGDPTGLTVNEIAYVTARSGDTLTLLRGQEGTTAKAWAAGDQVENLWTAGSAQVMVQEAKLQLQPGNWAIATGTSNAQVITLTPTPSSLNGLPIRFKAVGTNTGATTLEVPGVLTSTILNPDGSSLNPGQIQVNGVYEVVYDGSSFRLIGNPYLVLGRSNTWTSQQNFQGGAVGTTLNLSGQLQAGSAQIGGAISAAGMIYSSGGQVIGHTGVSAETGNVVANTGRLRAALGALGSGDLGAGVILNDFPSDLRGNGDYLWQELPNGLIFQSYFAVTSTGNGDTINLPNAFPTACNYVTVQESNPSGGNWITKPTIWGTQNYSRSAFGVFCSVWTGTQWAPGPGKNFRYLAIGH